MVFDENFLKELLVKAKSSKRIRQNFDLRNSDADTSQRMLNALLPGTQVPIHKHDATSETVVCLAGKLEQIYYECIGSVEEVGLVENSVVNDNKVFRETSRYLICPKEGLYGMQVAKGVWHTIEVLEPSVIFEAKDGQYIPR